MHRPNGEIHVISAPQTTEAYCAGWSYLQFKVRHGDLLARRSLFRLSPGIGLSMGYREDDKRRLGPKVKG